MKKMLGMGSFKTLYIVWIFKVCKSLHYRTIKKITNQMKQLIIASGW